MFELNEKEKEFIKEIKELQKDHDVIVMYVINRISEGEYLYNLKILVWRKGDYVKTYPRITSMSIYTGAFEDIRPVVVDILVQELGFEVI